jgi:CheY-like chemotaxis protein
MSRWLSGAEDLLHTHRMRALCDAVLVGSQTVLHDDPQLTVRRCTGTSPVRVVVDPERRLEATQRVFRDGVAPTLLLVAEDRAGEGPDPGLAELVPIARISGQLDPREIRRVLARLLMLEGFTVSEQSDGASLSSTLETGAPDVVVLDVDRDAQTRALFDLRVPVLEIDGDLPDGWYPAAIDKRIRGVRRIVASWAPYPAAGKTARSGRVQAEMESEALADKLNAEAK